MKKVLWVLTIFMASVISFAQENGQATLKMNFRSEFFDGNGEAYFDAHCRKFDIYVNDVLKLTATVDNYDVTIAAQPGDVCSVRYSSWYNNAAHTPKSTNAPRFFGHSDGHSYLYEEQPKEKFFTFEQNACEFIYNANGQYLVMDRERTMKGE